MNVVFLYKNIFGTQKAYSSTLISTMPFDLYDDLEGDYGIEWQHHQNHTDNHSIKRLIQYIESRPMR